MLKTIPLLFQPGVLRWHLKGGARRVFDAPRWHYVLWWLCRALLFVALVRRLAKPETRSGPDTLQLYVLIICSFLWEIFQFLPLHNSLRWVPPYIQDFSSLFIVLAGAGNMWELYERIRWWDSFLHIIIGILIVLAAYEVVVAFELRDKIRFPRTAALLFVLGISFMIAIFWEIYEFGFDQLMESDTQDWIYHPGRAALFPPLKRAEDSVYHMRFGLLDTMIDIILHTAGTIGTCLVLRFFPYHHLRKKQK